MSAQLLDEIAQSFLPRPPKVLGVAVSGGSDSAALLQLLHELTKVHSTRLHVVTVDHGLRAEGAAEARLVAARCENLGVPHETLRWEGWNGKGNLQNAARVARYDKIADWARRKGICTVALGHTANDQAETVLMRLARRSGVDGLSAMRMRTQRGGVNWVRPLLSITREALRDYLKSKDLCWIDDPSNQDTQFDRIKARQALDVLSPLGIDVTGLAEVAEHMSKCQQALDWQTFLIAKDIVRLNAGAVVFGERDLGLLPDEIQRRLFVNAMRWISGSVYTPRQRSVLNLITALRDGQAGTLDGCHARREGDEIWIFRELNAISDSRSGLEALWDGRWRIRPKEGAPAAGELSVGPLGAAGLAQCPNWRSSGLPHAVIMSTPAVWRGDTLVAAPFAGLDRDWHVELAGGDDTFFATILTH
ncbi:MAG: tRNA lysidine(34) synthetase TilS [Pseudomonadota bacterium]